MHVVYTEHAWERMQFRKIEQAWVEETIRRPDILTVIGRKHIAVRRLNGHTLKAVYVKEKYIKIVTLYWY